ncbi:MAG: hypothetical protein AB1641_26585 [Thermodesulfobacteriota bacterium]
MPEETKKSPASVGPGGDNMLQDLNLADIEGLEGAHLEGGRPLPKKVELDIDDMFLEEEEAAKPEEKPAPPAKEEPEKEAAAELPAKPAEEPKPRSPYLKIGLIAGAALVVAVLAAGLILSKMKTPPEPPPKAAVPLEMELSPFVVNHTGREREVIQELKLFVAFSDAQGRLEFENKTLIMRDIIFRFLQGRGPLASNDNKAKSDLGTALTELINRTLKQGQAKQVLILKVNPV